MKWASLCLSVGLALCLGGCASTDCPEGTHADYQCYWDGTSSRWGTLSLSLGAPVTYDSVQVRLYEGSTVERGHLLKWQTLKPADGKKLSWSEPEGSYSAQAIYWKGKISVEALDAGSISVSKDDHCTCYTLDVSDESLDLALEDWPPQ